MNWGIFFLDYQHGEALEGTEELDPQPLSKTSYHTLLKYSKLVDMKAQQALTFGWDEPCPGDDISPGAVKIALET